MSLKDQLPTTANQVIDASAIVVLLGSIVDALPSISAVLTFIWCMIRLYETRTVQRLLGRDEKP